MLIKDLPQPIKELALKRQIEQGKPKDEKVGLQIAFTWYLTTEGGDFWQRIYFGNFEAFYERYPQDKTPVEEIEVKGFSELSQAVKPTTREEQFERYIENTLQSLQLLIIDKGREYRRNNNPYHNFERGSILTGKPKEEVLQGFLLKHLISVEDMRNDAAKGVFPTESKIHEKYNDILVYFMLEKAMMLENVALYSESLDACSRALDAIAENALL